MYRSLLLLAFLFLSLSTYSQCIICPPDDDGPGGDPVDEGDGSGGTGGGETGGGGGSSLTVTFSGEENPTYNNTYPYSVQVLSGFHQSSSYTVSGGQKISESLNTVQVKWNQYGDRWVKVTALVGGNYYDKTVNVNVTGPLTGGSISASSSTNVCYDGNPSNINNSVQASGGDGTYSYTWQQSTNGGSSWSNAAGTTSGPTSFNPPKLTADRKYRRKVTSNGQTKYSNVISYSVYDDLDPQTITYTGGNVNPGGSVSITGVVATGGTGSYNYQWQKKTTGGYNDISGKTGRNLGIVEQDVTTTYRRKVVSCGTKYSNEISVTSNLVAGSVSSSSGTQLYYGQNPGVLTSNIATGGSGDYTYIWQESDDNVSWTNIGSSSSSPQPFDPPALTSDKWYRMKVTSDGQIKRKKIKLSVYPELVNYGINYTGPSVIAMSETVSITGNTPSGGSGSYSYQWQRKTTGSYEDIPGATNKNLTTLTQDVTTTYKRITMAGQIEESDEVIVETQLNPGNIGSDIYLCQGELTIINSVVDASGGSGDYSYTWYRSSVDGEQGLWEPIGGNYKNYDFDLTAETGPKLYKRAVTSGGVTLESNIVLVTPMTLENAGTLTYTGGNIPQGATPSSIAGSDIDQDEGLSGVTYEWSKKTLSESTFTTITGATGLNYSPGPLNEPTYFKRTATLCGVSQSVQVFIDLLYPPLLVGTLTATDTYFCYDCDPGAIIGDVPTGGTGTYEYQWQVQNQFSGEWMDVEGFEGNDSKDFDPDAPGTSTYANQWTYRRVVTSYNQTVANDPITISRDTRVTAGEIAYPTNPCMNTPIGLIIGSVPTGGMGGYTYNWHVDDGTGWSPVVTGVSDPNLEYSGSLTQEIKFKRTAIASDGTAATTPDLVLTPFDCSPDDFNYSRVEVPKSPVITEIALSNLAATDKSVSYSYSDGAGRPTVTVAVAAGQNEEDVVAFNHYNAYNGRQDKTYLPFYSDSAIPGMTFTQPEAIQESFYASTAGIANDTHPFAERTFDSRGRVKTSTSVGQEWHTNNKRTTYGYKYYKPGTDAAIGTWKIVNGLPVNDGIYGNSEVKINTVTDVENRKSRTAVDPLGRPITSQLYDPAAGKWFGSYNVYDDYGRVRFVIPAALTSTITDASQLGSLTQTQVDEQVFQYEYDRYGRVIRKKDPGSGWVEYIYDQWDRLVLSRHAAQQLDGADSWTFTKYDAWNRPVYSGQVALNATPTQLRADALAAGGRYETLANDEIGYTISSSFPQLGAGDFTSYEIHSISYYDNYTYQNNTNWDTEGEDFTFAMPAGFSAGNTTNVINQVTGSKTRVLGTDTWLNSVVYYDDRLRVIQTITENHLGGTERLSNDMDWKGELQKMMVEHSSANENVSILTEYEYAHNGQLLKTWQTINEPGNAGSRILVAEYNYNVLGQLHEKNLHSTDETSFLQSVDYDYNIKGWVSSINDAGLTDGENDIFGMEFNYTADVIVNGQTINGRYDGNLTSMNWNTDKDPLNGGDVAGQTITAYTYDERNRLTNSNYATDNSGSWTGNGGAYNMNATYDDSGNMDLMTRYADGDKIDEIDYDYEAGTHRLAKVEELSAHADSDKGFNDKIDMITEYTYDAMGNMTSDQNKEIVAINYNHLQLVESIVFGDGTTIAYTYDAGGSRLSKTITDGGGNELGKVDYAGLIEYNDGKVNQVATAEGRAYKQNNAYHYEYFLTDQQGNNRVAFGYLPEREVFTATMETENPEFDWTGVTRLTDENHTPTGTLSVALNNAVGRTLGPAKVLDIQTGDEVEIDVWARYKDAHGTANAFGSVLDALLAMTGGTIADGGVGEGLNNALGSGGTNPFPVVGNPSSSSDAPDAYLAYLFFDANYNYVDALSSYQAVTDASLEAWAKLETPEKLVFDQPGYLFVYVANESQEDQEVYFDDLRIVHENSTASFKVTQVNEYYPYGMQTDKSWRADGYIDPQLMYQSGYASYDSLTGYYDFLFRSYDPALGRFFAFDPMASSTPSYSPYHANFNNPISFTDPLGLSPRDSRFKDFGGFNSGGEGDTEWSMHLDAEMMKSGLGRVNSLGPTIVDQLSVMQMAQLAVASTPKGGYSKTEYYNGFPIGKIVINQKAIAARNKKKGDLNLEDYWIEGEQLANGSSGGVITVFATKDIFNWNSYLSDYIGASDFGQSNGGGDTFLGKTSDEWIQAYENNLIESWTNQTVGHLLDDAYRGEIDINSITTKQVLDRYLVDGARFHESISHGALGIAQGLYTENDSFFTPASVFGSFRSALTGHAKSDYFYAPIIKRVNPTYYHKYISPATKHRSGGGGATGSWD